MPHDPSVTSYLFEHARDIILVIDAETGVIIDANHAAEVAYQYSRAELLALKIFDLRVEAPVSVSVQMKLATAHGILFDAIHRRRDGTQFWVEVSSRGDLINNRSCLFSIIRDATERKRFEAERDELLASSQRALALRDEFLMIASHELRTPVTNVSLQLQQLSRLIDRGAPLDSVGAAGQAALREARRLTSLIDTLLDAQATKSQLALDVSEVELAELVHDVTDRFKLRADDVGSEITVDVPAVHGRWDRVRIDQVLTNLLLNALKYGRGRPVRVTARLDPPWVHLEVWDQGIGVTTADSDRIFDKFERAVPPHYGGLGLGLFIIRQIAEAHGGKVEIESTPNVGSTFRVTLPV